MSEVTPRDRAQRSYSLVLRRLSEVKAGDVAKDMGVSDSTVSELKNKAMEPCLALLAHLGLKVVPSEFRCVDPTVYAFLTAAHKKMVDKAPALLWGDDE